MYIQISSSNKNKLVFKYDSTGEEDSQITFVLGKEEIPVIEGTGEILEDVSSTGKVKNWSEKKRMNRELVKIFEYAREKIKI